MWCIICIDFSYVELFLHSWDETIMVVVNDLFNVLLNSVSKDLTEKFYVCVHQGYWALVFVVVVVVSLSGFGFRAKLAS